MKSLRLSLLPLGVLLASTLGCPEKRAPEATGSGSTASSPPPAVTREAAPAAPTPAPQPPLTPRARALLGPADVDALHIPGGLTLQPLAGKPTTPSFDGVNYVGKSPGPGL